MKTGLHVIQNTKNIRFEGLLYEPTDVTTKRVLAHVHGMGGTFYENFFLQPIAKLLTANGVAFSPFNNSGNGLVTTLIKEVGNKAEYVEGGTYRERFEDCVDDIKAHLDFLEGQGYKEIYLSGHSLGAPKVAYYLDQTKDPRVKSLIFLSPADMLGLVRNEDSDIAKWLETANLMVSEGKGDDIMPEWVWGEYPVSANTFLNLFGDDSNTAIFNFLDQKKGFDILSNISIPVLTVMGSEDDALVINIDEAMKLIEEKVSSSPKSVTKVIEGAPHSYYHYEQVLAEVVRDWVCNP